MSIVCFVNARANILIENKYYIEICSIPLKDILNPKAEFLVADIKHIFVRGYNGTAFSGLNFEPQKPWEFLSGKARIGRQNYEDAQCKHIYSTQNLDTYLQEWEKFVSAYERYAKNQRYNIGMMNCQQVTKAILKTLGYVMPEKINSELDF